MDEPSVVRKIPEFMKMIRAGMEPDSSNWARNARSNFSPKSGSPSPSVDDWTTSSSELSTAILLLLFKTAQCGPERGNDAGIFRHMHSFAEACLNLPA
jgi:hypothetical protein